MADNKTGTKLIAPNKKARHDYFVLDTYEAGIELFGTEVKSIRRGGVNLKDSYCCIEKGEMFAEGIHISPYEQLLMHKKEINKLLGTVSQQGLTLVPLSMYFKGSRVKVEIGLCKGKKLYDKRDAAAAKEADRNIERTMKTRARDGY